MSYQVLALKYRPQQFEDVVGQDHVTTTLTNAILSDRMAHAILLTGPRGTGKTTIARILAKAMNCAAGPCPAPCNTCAICKDIIQGHCADVFEIDGASNNSVDQIRDLRENVAYMPSSARYKIYIIDEVHMLSVAAFNALLKTLEEPPAHVLFIFATTEVQKIPMTILSRCQRHDLSRIPAGRIADHLKRLCEKEGFKIQKDSLDLIAREADGSIRDGLSLLDRILSSAAERQVDPQRVLTSLGIIGREVIHDIGRAVLDQDGRAIVEIVGKISDSGMDLKKFYVDILSYFRHLNVIRICGKDSPAVDLTDSEKEAAFQTACRTSAAHIHAVLNSLLADENLVRYGTHTRTALEMTLLKAMRIDSGAQIDHILHQLDALTKQISGRSTEPISGRIPPDPTERTQPAENDPAERDADPQPPTVCVSRPGWPDFLRHLEQTQPSVFTILSRGAVQEPSPNELLVELANCSSFEGQRVRKKEDELRQMCDGFLGKRLTIRILELSPPPGKTGQDQAEVKAGPGAFTHPLVIEAQKMFNGEIIYS